MTQKGRIYNEKGTMSNSDLFEQLSDATELLKERMKASIAIFKGGRQIGFGVNKVQRNIAVDSVISIAKAIRSIEGWH